MLVLLIIAGCDHLEAPDREGVLVVGLVSEPTFPLSDGTPAEGFTQDVVRVFSEQLGVPVRFHFAVDAKELTLLALQGRVHIAAYLNAGPENDGLSFTASMGSLPLWVVRHIDAPGPESLADLDKLKIEAPVGSAAAMALKSLGPDIQPELVEVSEHAEMDILQWLSERRIALAAVDELNMRLAANIYPELTTAVRLPGSRSFSWAIAAGFDDLLLERANRFIAESEKNGLLPRLRDRHFGYIRRIDAMGAQNFIQATKQILPRYQRAFQLAQEVTGLDWRLIAALAYQESKWDPLATSATSVRGMMMLTEDTADHLGVQNRLDAMESIRGGARYLVELMDQLPPSVVAPDRLWMALAAYNLGMGHLNGGRAIAKSLKRNPDSWYEMKMVLPLMSRPEYYERLKSGRARGGEAVILVENVRSYFSILSHIEPLHVQAIDKIPKVEIRGKPQFWPRLLSAKPIPQDPGLSASAPLK